jgi:hypothetical protein
MAKALIRSIGWPMLALGGEDTGPHTSVEI